jgi:hypothetical protein
MARRGLPKRTDGPANATRPNTFSEWKNVARPACPPEDCNGNERPMSTWDQRFLYQICTFRCDKKEKSRKTSRSLSLSCTPVIDGFSLCSGHTHLFIDRCQPLSLCMRLTIGFNSGCCCCVRAWCNR